MYNNNTCAPGYYFPNNQQQQQYSKPSFLDMKPTGFVLKGHPVASFEEAKTSMIDFDGSVFYFPDIANKRIYTKQINPDGTASFGMYEYKEIQEQEQIVINPDYITRTEFEEAIAKLAAGKPQGADEPAKTAEKAKPQTYNF